MQSWCMRCCSRAWWATRLIWVRLTASYLSAAQVLDAEELVHALLQPELVGNTSVIELPDRVESAGDLLAGRYATVVDDGRRVGRHRPHACARLHMRLHMQLHLHMSPAHGAL